MRPFPAPHATQKEDNAKAPAAASACTGQMQVGCWNERYNMTTNDAAGQAQMVFGELNDGGG